MNSELKVEVDCVFLHNLVHKLHVFGYCLTDLEHNSMAEQLSVTAQSVSHLIPVDFYEIDEVT